MIPFAELDKGSELTVLDNLTGKQVPQGVPLTLGTGETVLVTQALGDRHLLIVAEVKSL